MRRIVFREGLIGWLSFAAQVSANGASPEIAKDTFMHANPGVRMYDPAGRISRVYGTSFSQGDDAPESASNFIMKHAAMFGVEPDALALDASRTRPIMLDPHTGSHAFTVFWYEQFHAGLPVHEAMLILMVRNEPGFPLVLASSSLRDLRDFDPEIDAQRNDAIAHDVVNGRLPGAMIESTETIIWAGSVMNPQPPHVAWRVDVHRGVPGTSSHERIRMIVDADTGMLLHEESLIKRGAISGDVNGLATQGFDADICDRESPMGLPYVDVHFGGEFVTADEHGAFSIDIPGIDPVTLEVLVRGPFFRVFNLGGPDSVLSLDVAPPGPASFLFNPLNEEFTRAEVNAYLHANIGRDYILAHVPDYPGVSTHVEFPVRVNAGGQCDAFFDGVGINFLSSSPNGSPFDCPNSAHSTVVYHEYGHFVHAAGGLGAPDYGEGIADAIAVIISDDPDFSTGHFGDCDVALRSAESGLQFPCSSTDPHICGQLLSGSVWETRNALARTDPDNARTIITTLTLNSIMIHGPEGIDPGLTIDFLTLDDDNADLNDGTPHYNEIAEGFGAHNLDAPPLLYLEFDFPEGIPEFISPTEGATIAFNVLDTKLAELSPDAVEVFIDIGKGFEPGEVTALGDDAFEAHLPPTACGTEIRFYLAAHTTSAQMQFMPVSAPDDSLRAFSAGGEGEVIAFDELENDAANWMTSADTPIFGGVWQHVVPIGSFFGGQPAGPSEDATPDPGVMAFVTHNGAPNVDGGPVYLTSPAFDLAGATAFVEYAAWFFESAWPGTPAADALYVDVSNDDGETWVLADMVTTTSGQWETRRFSVNHFVEPSDQVRIRFRTFDSLVATLSSFVEAGVDDLRIAHFDCSANPIGDLDSDGDVDFADLLALLAAWGACDDDCVEDLNGSGDVGFADLLILLSNWS